MTDKSKLEEMARKLADQGKLIEAGWIGLRIAAVPLDAPETQVREMRKAFFAGALHLFTSMMSVMDGGDEVSENDLKRMDLINDELDAFGKQLAAEVFASGPGH